MCTEINNEHAFNFFPDVLCNALLLLIELYIFFSSCRFFSNVVGIPNSTLEIFFYQSHRRAVWFSFTFSQKSVVLFIAKSFHLSIETRCWYLILL